MAISPIDQIQEAKRELELVIKTAVQTFCDTTGVKVDDIRVTYERTLKASDTIGRPTGPRKVSAVSAEVYLPEGD